MTSLATQPLWKPSPAAYVIAVFGIVVVTAGRMLLNEIAEPHIPLVTFHLVILTAAMLGGIGPALLSLISGYLVAGFAFDAPRAAFGVFGMPDLWATAAYMVVGVAVAACGTVLRLARRQTIDNELESSTKRAELMRQLDEAEAQLAALRRSQQGSARVGIPPQLSVARIDAHESTGTAGATAGAARVIRVVDDEHDNADSLALLLRMHHYETAVSYDGISALAADAPDVMIVDINLPDIDGYEIARRVRIDPRFARTHLIALSGFGSDEDRARATRAGFDHHLTKPIDFKTLQALLEQL